MKWKLKNFAEKLKTVKHIEIVLLAAAVCIALLIYMGVSGSRDEDTPVYTPQSQSMSDEARLQTMLESIAGVGECNVMITYAEDGSTEGVVVSAEGANDMKVKLKIIDIICTLLDVDGGKIKVYGKN